MRKLEIGECEGEKVGKWCWGVGESDLGFRMFNFSPQLRGTLTRGLRKRLLTLSPQRSLRGIGEFKSVNVRMWEGGFGARSLSVGDLGDVAPT